MRSPRGDSIAVYPPRNKMKKWLKRLRTAPLSWPEPGHKRPCKYSIPDIDGQLYVIEVNPRASRTIPFISKITGVPMVDIASKVMLGYSLKSLGLGTQMMEPQGFYAVKVPVFPFEKFQTPIHSWGLR